MNKVLMAAGKAAKHMIPAFVGMGSVIIVTLMVAKTTILSWVFWIGAIVFIYLIAWFVAYKSLK